MTALALTVAERDGRSTDVSVDLRRMFNLGSATRDPHTAVAHQREVERAGVRIAFDRPPPRIYPIAGWALTTASVIGAQGAHTSGEAEVVLVVADDLYIGVGSDHTDRDLERVSIPWSKQVCPNVLGGRVWRFSDVADHWDACVLGSTVDGEDYQLVGVDAFLSPPDVLGVLRDRAAVPDSGLVVFCGTIASLSGELGFGREWSCWLTDPVLGRDLTVGYRVEPLLDEVRPDHRVPLLATGEGAA